MDETEWVFFRVQDTGTAEGPYFLRGLVIIGLVLELLPS